MAPPPPRSTPGGVGRQCFARSLAGQTMWNLISTSECLEILRESLSAECLGCEDITSFEVKRAPSDLVGFMGEYYKLFVELRDKRKLSYFIKSLPITNEIHRKECLDKKYFDKETRLYTDVLRDIQKYVPVKLYPECYYTRLDILVLEDLSTQPLRHITNTYDVPFAYYQTVLTVLANLHAGSIAYERHTGVDIGEKFKDILFDLQLTMSNPWYVTGIKGIVSLAKRLPKYKGTRMEHFIAEGLFDYLCAASHLSDASPKYRNVLCHRDTWARNIFFECDASDSPVSCLIVDFQLTRYCPQAIDVLNFLYMTTGRTQRDAITDMCLDFYYSAFVRALTGVGLAEEAAPKTTFLDSCRELVLVPLIIKATCAPLMLMPEGLSNKWRAEEQVRFDYYMNTDRDEMFERVMAIEPSYRRAIFEPLEELLEFVERSIQ